jgi:hypothetical protein
MDGGEEVNIVLEGGPRFSDKEVDKGGSLHALDQAVVLALCLDVGNSNPRLVGTGLSLLLLLIVIDIIINIVIVIIVIIVMNNYFSCYYYYFVNIVNIILTSYNYSYYI